MRKKFWEKLNADDRNFMWFFRNNIKGKIKVNVGYGTLYKQARKDYLQNMDDGLKLAMKKYLEEEK